MTKGIRIIKEKSTNVGENGNKQKRRETMKIEKATDKRGKRKKEIGQRKEGCSEI